MAVLAKVETVLWRARLRLKGVMCEVGEFIWATAEPSNPFKPFSPQLSLEHRPDSENLLWPERKAELGPVVHTGLFIGSKSL